MKVGFYLNTPKNNASALRAIVRHKGQRYVISVGESVIPKYWNDKTHLCRTVRDYPEASHINARLNDWASLIEDAINSFGLITPTPKMVKDKANEIIRIRNIEAGGIVDDLDSQLFVSFIKTFISEAIRAKHTTRIRHGLRQSLKTLPNNSFSYFSLLLKNNNTSLLFY